MKGYIKETEQLCKVIESFLKTGEYNTDFSEIYRITLIKKEDGVIFVDITNKKKSMDSYCEFEIDFNENSFCIRENYLLLEEDKNYICNYFNLYEI